MNAIGKGKAWDKFKTMSDHANRESLILNFPESRIIGKLKLNLTLFACQCMKI